MHIFIITSELPPHISGGLGTHVGNLSKGLKERDIEVTIILIPYYAEQGGNSYIWEGMRVILLPFPQIGMDEHGRIIFQDVLKAFINEIKKPEDSRELVIHAHEWFGYLIGRVLQQKWKVSLITTFHLFSHRPFLLGKNEKLPSTESGKLIAAAEKEAGINSTALIYVSAYLKHIGEEAYNFAPSLGTVVHNCRDESMLNNLEHKQSSEISIQQDDLDDDILIVGAGRLIQQKGFLYLLQAMLPVFNVVPTARLVIAGSGPMETLLKQEAAFFKEKVQFTGFLDKKELLQLIRKTKIGVVPSCYEPFGIAALDFMQVGVPVIASDIGGLKEIIIDGESGILIPMREGRSPVNEGYTIFPDINKLSAALINLALDKNRRIKMGIAAKKQSMKFSCERFITETIHIYNTMLSCT